MRNAILGLVILSTGLASSVAAERHWQTGTWTGKSVKRQIVDFGPGASPFARSRPDPSMRAMADVHVYVIETDALRLELPDMVQVNKRSVDVVVGEPVTFALDKKS